jgi:osmotically-inducible protein OsmY
VQRQQRSRPGKPSEPSLQSLDPRLADQITFRLESNPALKKYDLEVVVAGGVATIKGRRHTGSEDEAARIARIKGISRVNNTIMVDKDVDATVADRAKAGLTKTGKHLTDAWIAAKVQWFFDREPLLKGSDIRVQSSDHVVTLAGMVPSPAEKVRAVAKGLKLSS